MSASSAASAIVALCLLAAVPLAGGDAPKPSANAGRIGVYHAATSRPGCNYWVYVPKSYAAERPAGIHVFFHGLGGQAMARTSWHLWAHELLDGCNLIGINMEYTDGNPHADAPGKADAAREAVQQIAADYRIVLGRGAMTAFSAGGSPAGAWITRYGKNAAAYGTDWPFCHVAVFGSSLNCGPEVLPLATSWMRAMGDGEEGMAPGLLRYMTTRMAGNLRDTAPGACPDAVLNLTRGRGHTILPEDVQRSAALFKRASLIMGPWLRREDAADPALAAAIDLANHQRTGDALAALARLGGEPAAAVRRRIEAHVEEQVALCRTLAGDDPLLACAYAGIVRRQLAGHAALKPAEAALAPLAKEAARWQAAQAAWAQRIDGLFDRGCRLKAEAVPFLTLRATCGERSAIGHMAGKFLRFAPDPSEAPKAPAR